MRYIINDNIKYHEDRSELMAMNDDVPPQQLTATLNRLLSALVRNNNLVLSRETLLSQVWEAHGQVASGNNLNNTISILRKMFAALGEDDIIVTLPRQGFMFTAATLKTADSLAEKLAEAEPESVAAVAASPRRNLKHLKSIVLAALFALAAGSAVWAWQDTGYPPFHSIAVGKIDNCSVRFITTFYKPGLKEIDLDHLRNMLQQRPHIQCKDPATLLYYDTQTLTPNGAGRTRSTYFYYCPQSLRVEGKTQCESFYESWGM